MRRSLILASLVALFVQPLVPASASLITWNVTTTSDLGDTNPGDRVCSSGAGCTLRAAIEEANLHSGLDQIHFAIPGTGVHTLQPSTPYPPLTERTIINGFTQPGTVLNTVDPVTGGSNASPLIEIDGTNAGGGASGLTINEGADNSLIRGMVINGFANDGIAGVHVDKTRIEGNFIGVRPDGLTPRANGGTGVDIQGNRTSIGGEPTVWRNIISMNGSAGVVVGNDALVERNLIGTGKDATTDLGNGTDPSGFGVKIAGSRVTVASNVIAYSSGHGVLMPKAVGAEPENIGNQISENSIFSNDKLGIDLADPDDPASGVTPNHGSTVVAGPNHLQNHPVIASATTSTVTSIDCSLVGPPSKKKKHKYLVEFFRNQVADPSGSGEGKTLIGSLTAKTDKNGLADCDMTTSSPIPVGEFITATASEKSNGGINTSEFSQARIVE